MNQIVLDLIPKGATTATAAGARGTAGKSTAKAGDMFRAALSDRLSAAASDASDTSTLRTLQSKIGQLFAAGASQAGVIAKLAAQLTSSVAHAAGDTADARGTLQTLFARALAPPGKGDQSGAPTADRVRALAQRYLQIAAKAQKIAGQSSGQQTRIAGHVLDAQRAKDIPARRTTGTHAPAALHTAAIANVTPLAAGLAAAADARNSAAKPQLADRLGRAALTHDGLPLQSAETAASTSVPAKHPRVQPATAAQAERVTRLAASRRARASNESNPGTPGSVGARHAAASSIAAPRVAAQRQHAAVTASNAASPNAVAPKNGPAPAAVSDPSSTGRAAGVTDGDVPGQTNAASEPVVAAAGAAGQQPLPARPTADGDAKRVDLRGRTAVAAGGGTSLGRTLTRAALPPTYAPRTLPPRQRRRTRPPPKRRRRRRPRTRR